MKHIILGNGAAGVVAAEKLRELRPEDEITMVTGEKTPVYSKCMLPDYIGDKMGRDKLFIRQLEHYKNNRIDLRLGFQVENVDTGRKQVILQNGEALIYDKLLIAVGGVPYIPPIEGIETLEYYAVNSIRDADAVKERAEEGRKAIIVGAGLNGIEMGFALKRQGMQVTLLEREERILPRQLDSFSANVLVEQIRKEGIELVLGSTLQKVWQDMEGRKHAQLTGGQILDFDLLVLSIGTRPNTAIVRNTDIKCSRGVLIDRYMQTSVEDVYAAGDVSETMEKLSDEYVTSYIWPNAMAQGKCAAYNMAGQPQEFSPAAVMQNSVQLRDIPFISMGMINPKGSDCESIMQYDGEKGTYKKLVLKGRTLAGMVLLGDTSQSNMLGTLMRKKTDISEMKSRLLDGAPVAAAAAAR